MPVIDVNTASKQVLLQIKGPWRSQCHCLAKDTQGHLQKEKHPCPRVNGSLYFLTYFRYFDRKLNISLIFQINLNYS